MVPVSVAGVEPLQMVCAALMLLFEMAVGTVQLTSTGLELPQELVRYVWISTAVTPPVVLMVLPEIYVCQPPTTPPIVVRYCRTVVVPEPPEKLAETCVPAHTTPAAGEGVMVPDVGAASVVILGDVPIERAPVEEVPLFVRTENVVDVAVAGTVTPLYVRVKPLLELEVHTKYTVTVVPLMVAAVGKVVVPVAATVTNPGPALNDGAVQLAGIWIVA